MQFVIKSFHQPDQCPTANSKTRQAMIKTASEFPQLAQKLGIKFIVGPLFLGAEHETVSVVEADKIETVTQFLVQSGLVQWNTMRVSPAMTLQEALETLKKVPEPLY